MIKPTWMWCALGLLAGCSSSHSQPDGPPGAIDAAHDGPQGAAIPPAGTGHEVDNNFDDTEPNDTPAQAVALGVAASSVYTWVTNDMIGGTDTWDYFVFESSPTGGMFTLGSSGLCYQGAITSLTATLWKVVDAHEVTPPVGTWTMSGMNACLPGSATLEPNTEYLLGLNAAGGAGTYAA